MAVTYVIRFQVVPEQKESFLALLNGVISAMRHETTFVHAVLHSDPSRESRFMLCETWESHDDVLNVQLARPYRREWHDALPTLLEEERDIEIWHPLG